jgi:hypothetical protein
MWVSFADIYACYRTMESGSSSKAFIRAQTKIGGMTIASAWVRSIGECEELLFVTDSRL